MNMARLGIAGAAALALFAFSCGREPQVEIVEVETVEPLPISVGWDSVPESVGWTDAALAALGAHGEALVKMTPGDINTYCPNYGQADEAERRAFWVSLLSALSRHESAWRPDVSGGDGRWHGLLQISPGTAQGYGCRAQSAEALRDGAENLSCGIRIMAATVTRDGVISEGMRGIAADWGPFHQSRKREDIQTTTRAQPFCSD